MLNLVLCIIAFAAASIFDQAAFAVTSSPLKTYTGPECGAPSYENSQREECGVAEYALGVGEPCGAKRYNSQTSPSCPGSDPGGRTVQGSLSSSGISISNLTVSWADSSGSLQHDEDIIQVLGRSQSLLGSGPFVQWTRDTNYWQCSFSATQFGFPPRTPLKYSGRVICTAKPDIRSCELPEFGIAEYNSCRNPAFGVAAYNLCPDLARPLYQTCQLRKTREELDAYINEVLANISFHAELFANNFSTFLSRYQDKIQSTCLIDKYIDNAVFDSIVGALKDKFEATYGELYEKDHYKDSCDSQSVAPINVEFADLSCSNLSTDDVRNGVVQSGSDAKLKRFYQDCFSQKSYELPLNWFTFHLAETQLLIDDVVSKSDPTVKDRLDSLMKDLRDANVSK